MPIEIASEEKSASRPPPRPSGAAVVDWRAGSPVFEGAPAADKPVASEPPPYFAWLLKPGDLVCDWLKVADADSRGLLRLFINLTIYTKIAAAIAFLAA